MNFYVATGTYLLMRVDGLSQTLFGTPSQRDIARLIGADTLDVVALTRDSRTGLAGLVMLVDDTGIFKHKPINMRATEICREFFGQNWQHYIAGDAVVMHDSDTGEP